MSPDLSDDGEFVIEGRIAVEALLACRRFEILDILIEEGRHLDLVERLSSGSFPFRQLSGEVVRAEAGYDFHRGVMARARRPFASEPSAADFDRWNRIVVPVGLADPGNLGTVIRNGAAFGADAVLVERGRGADVWGRKAIRASATAVFRLPVYEVADLKEIIERAAQAGFVSYATSLSKKAKPLEETTPQEKTMILFGAEKDGLGAGFEAICDELVSIPMANEMDSINVAAAAAIVCHRLFARASL